MDSKTYNEFCRRKPTIYISNLFTALEPAESVASSGHRMEGGLALGFEIPPILVKNEFTKNSKQFN